MKQYECDACGNAYDPEKGDPENGSNLGHRLTIFPKIGSAHCAVWVRVVSR